MHFSKRESVESLHSLALSAWGHVSTSYIAVATHSKQNIASLASGRRLVLEGCNASKERVVTIFLVSEVKETFFSQAFFPSD